MKPIRIQRKRTKGFNLQKLSRSINGLEAIVVSRPTRWGNPFVVGRDGNLEESINFYFEWATHSKVSNTIKELKGKNLACWCKIMCNGKYIPCHADVLLEIANR